MNLLRFSQESVKIILVGNITQYLTDHLTDSSSIWQDYYPLLQTEQEHRFFTLVGLCHFFGLKMGEGSLLAGEFTSTEVNSLQTYTDSGF